MATWTTMMQTTVSRCLLLLLYAASLTGTIARETIASPFPLSVVSNKDERSALHAPHDDLELTIPAHNVLGSPDLQHMAKRVTWFAFCIAIVCILVIAYANQRNRKTRLANGEFHVVDTISLGPRCFCDLLSVRGQYFVVARDSTGLKDIRQVNNFSDTFTAASENLPSTESSAEDSPEHEIDGNSLFREGVPT